MNASEQILQYVEHARQEAKRAEDAYDSAAFKIQLKSQSSIDLYGGNAASRVAEIASLSRNASEELYSTYQGLIRYLDEKCRPLLEEGADEHSVKELVELMKWLNNESEIGTNYTASLNGSDMGSILNVQYSPTVENRMIQKYWQTAYAAMPGAEEENRKYQKRIEEERLARIEARKRRAEEEKRRLRAERERAARKKEEDEKARAAQEENLKEEIEELRPIYRVADRMISIGTNTSHAVAAVVMENGRVFAKGNNNDKQCEVSSWRNIIQVVTNGTLTVGLCADGSVVATGNMILYRLSSVTGWYDVKKIAMGEQFVVGLRKDGRVYITGDNPKGHPASTVEGPMYWTGIVDIFCINNKVIGKKADGSFVAVNYNYYGTSEKRYIPQEWKGNEDIDGSKGYNEDLLTLMPSGKVDVYGRKIRKPEEINRHGGIVKVKAFKDHPIAIFYDGTILMEEKKDRDDIVYRNFNQFVTRHGLNGRILAIDCNGDLAMFLTTDGEVYSYATGYFISGGVGTGKLETENPVFTDWKTSLKKIADADKLQKRLREKEERQKAEYRAKGVCQYCGGEFKKGFLAIKCAECGRKKDY